MTREGLDFFATPAPVTWAILDAIGLHTLNGLVVLDPCAGDGAILDAAAGRGAECDGYEIDPGRAAACATRGHRVGCDDAMRGEWTAADLLIQNPPFNRALEFVRKAAEWSQRHRREALSLVRLGFMSTKGRAAFHREYPSDAYVLAGRPSFTGDGGTDRYDYVWLVHGPGQRGRWTTLEWSKEAS